MAGCKVYIINVCLIVDACLEVDAFQVPVVPPVPCHLSRLYPRAVPDPRWSCQGIHHVVDGHVTVVLCHGDDAPGVCPLSLRLGNILLRLTYVGHASPWISLHGLRVWCEQRPQLATVCLYEHSRIAHQVRLKYGHLGIAAVYCCR